MKFIEGDSDTFKYPQSDSVHTLHCFENLADLHNALILKNTYMYHIKWTQLPHLVTNPNSARHEHF